MHLNDMKARKSYFKFKNNKLNYRLKLLVVAVPLIVLVLTFNYLPLFGWGIAFVDYRPGLSIFRQDFAGFKYFTMLLSPPGEFLNVIKNTLALGFLIILTTPIPMVFAILLSQLSNRKFSVIVQSVSAFPYFVSYVIIYSLCFSFFSSEDGAINILMMRLGLIDSPGNILGNPNLSWLLMTLVYLFKNLGFSAIIYLATLAGVNPELYDAADVDGAGRFSKIIHITLPHLANTFFVLLLLSISLILTGAGFEQYFVFRNPLVANRLEVFDIYAFRLGITNGFYSLATAVSLFKSLFSILLLLGINNLSKTIRGYKMF